MEVKVIKSKRNSLSLSVDDNLNAIVKAPYFVSDSQIADFVKSNSLWLEKAVDRKRKQLEKYNLSDIEISELKKRARTVLPERVKYYSNIMGVTPTDVKITSAKKRFGSCNGKNSLCFSLYLMLYPDEAIDYVVVHELAHIRHHNHSRDFYAFVASVMPDYKQRERLLKN